MAFTNGNDVNILQASDSLNVGAGLGDDKYILSSTGLTAGQTINITDTQGTNTLQLIGGLTIASSKVAANAIQLTLSNGAIVNVFGADTFKYEIGGDPLTGTSGTIQNFSSFVTSSLGATVPTGSALTDGATNVGVNSNGTTTANTPTVPTFSVTGAAAAAEGTDASFVVSLAARGAGAYSVNVALAATGGATAGTDFANALTLDAASTAAGITLVGNVLTIPAASTVTSVTLKTAIANDAITPETGEGLSLTLSAPTGTGVVLGTSTVTTAITDVPVTVPYTLTAASTNVNEGASATFNLVTTAAEAGKTVSYTLSGTGITAADVTGGLTGTVTVGADGKAAITVPVIADATTEGPETLTVTLDGKNASASTIINDTSVGPDASFFLTKGQDIATANKFFASQTQFNVDGVGPTLNTSDFLTGTAGRTDNSLTITDLTPGVGNANIPAGVTLTNIQNIILNASGNTAGGNGFSTVGYSDVRTLNAATNGGLADIIAAKNGVDGTTITATHNGFAGNLTVVGGTDVTATTVGGDIIVGNSGLARVPLSTEKSTGAVVVNQNNSGAGKVDVFGGTTVNVTTSSNSNTGVIEIGNTAANTGNNVAGALANPSGNIKVSTAGSGAVTIFGGADVAVTDTATKGAGAITIGDVGRVDSSNQATGTVTVTETNQIAYNGLAGSSNNNTTSGAISVYGGKDVNITTNASNLINIGNLGAAKENSLNPTGAITVTNTGIVDNVAASKGTALITGGTNVTVSTTGADVTIGRSANGVIDQASNPTGTVIVNETLNGNGFGRTVTIDGGKDVTVNAKGQTVLIGTANASAPTGAVKVTQADILTGNGAWLSGTNAGNVTVDGGTTVTVDSTGGSVTIGGVVGGVNTVPTGAVTVTGKFSGPGADATSVQGGTTVNVTTTKTSGTITIGAASTALNAAGTTLKDSALAPSGDVTIVDATTAGSTTAYGTGNVNVNTNGAATVSIKGGDVDAIADIQSTLATGGSNSGKAIGTSKLATVVIDGQTGTDNITIASDALTALSLLNNKGGANNVTITNNTDAHSLTITQGGNTTNAWVNGAAVNNAFTVIDAKATGVTVTDNGTASTAVLGLTTVKATALTVNNAAAATINVAGDTELTAFTLKGAGAVTLQNVDTLTKVATIDASQSSGAVTTSISPTASNGISQKFTGGSGLTTLTVTTNAFSYGDGVLLTGGSGTTDVLVANYAAAATDVALGSGTASVKNFEFLGLGALANSAAGNYDASGFSGVTLGAVAGNVAVTNAAKNASLSITAAPGFTTSFTGTSAATTGTTDGLTINVGTSTTTGIAANTVTANGYEAVSIVSNGASGTNTLTLKDSGSAGTGTLAISGAGALTLTDNDATNATRFSSIAVTNTKAVDVDLVSVSNKGATITGGAGALKATGATGGTEQVIISITGDTANAATVIVRVNGTDYTYTNGTGAAVSATAAATGVAAAITAGAIAGVTATASGSNVIVQKAVAIGAAALPVTIGAGTSAATVNASLVGGTEEAVITIGTGTVVAADTTRVVINGNNIDTAAAAGGETSAQIATALAAAITAAIGTTAKGVVSAVASGSTVVITSGTGTTGVAQIGAVSQPVHTGTMTAPSISTATINYATANDSFTSGSGGGTYTAGLGGSWNATTHKYSSGSETVNLAASTAKVDTLKLADGIVVTNNGTAGGVTSFTTGNLLLSDSLNFATAGKTALANVTVPAAVSAVTGAATMAAVLDPSGALLTALANLTYTISNGVITFSATGGHSLTEFTTAQLISAAEILTNSSSTGGVNKVVVFSSGGNSYVVASDAAATLATGVDAKDILVQLTGVASSSGFGTTGAQGTIVTDTVTNVTSNAVNTGSATVAVYDQAGFSLDTITNAELGTVSTSITNLAPSAKLALGTNATGPALPISITQTGSAGLNSLTLDLANETFNAITVNGDGLLVLNPTGNATINSLVDGGSTNTLSTIKVGAGAFTLDVKAITDTALTAIDSSAAGGTVTFGSTTAIANNGVTFTLAAGQNSVITASGANDIFSQGAGAGVVTLTASGASNTITALSTGAGNTITANGAGDTISVGGTGSFTVTATGSNDTINIAAGAGSTSVTVGTAATVNIGTANTANAGADTVVVTGAVTGGTTASYASTTINFVSGSTITGNIISFGTTGDAFSMLGDSTPATNATAAEVAASQVNVASATSLTEALNIAANYTLLTQNQGAAVTTANLAANTGVIDWFQYGGDTYLVAMVNSTGAAVQQTALNADDIVVKITGLVDLSTASTFTQATETFTI